jgi:uncharacterized repeat protein (TIGR03837 family)
VVDNFGDAAVAFRLARILAQEQGYAVRLLIDDHALLARLLQRDASDALPWLLDGVVVDAFDSSRASRAPLLIEAFGCGLPPGFMAARPPGAPSPVLINVEYLTAEQWPDGVHGLCSPPRDGLPARYFFFPGFSLSTGGLLREHDVSARRRHVQGERAAASALWQRLGLDAVDRDLPAARRVSMFCYQDGFAKDWFERLVGQGRTPLHLLLAEGVMSRQVVAFCGSQRAGSTRQVGDLKVSVVPFLSQPEYDQLLAACDANLVRGEDSFVRAQLAGRPMLWDIYPQDEFAHLAKHHAFTDLYCSQWPYDRQEQYLELSRALIERSDALPGELRRWCDDLEQFQRAASDWLQRIEGLPELGAQLAIFAEKLLK